MQNTISKSFLYFALFLSFYSSSSLASPTTKRHDLCNGSPGQFVYNKDPKTNSYVKGGFVAHTAKVRGHKAFLGKWRGYFLTSKVFIGPEAQVCEFAQIKKHARVTGQAIVKGYAIIQGNAHISGQAVVGGEAVVTDQAVITEKASVQKKSIISGSSSIQGSAKILSHATITDQAIVEGESVISDFAEISGYTHIKDQAQIYGHTKVSGKSMIQGRSFLMGHTQIHDATVQDHSRILGPRHNQETPLTLLGPLCVQGYSCIQDSILLNHGVWDSQRLEKKTDKIFHTLSIQDKNHMTSDECSICLEPLNSQHISGAFEQSYLQTLCGHHFHQDCIKSCLQNSDTCPLCRKPLFSETLKQPIEINN